MPLSLFDSVNLHNVYSSADEIRGGRFKFSEDSVSWRFVPPINWANMPAEPEVARVIQKWAMIDPFLEFFDETRDPAAIDQAIFFMLDWQGFHQRGRKITKHAWDEDAVRERVSRLAYVLSMIEIHPELTSKNYSGDLIGLADFHIQRSINPDFGLGSKQIFNMEEFRTLCQVLDALPSCQMES